MTSYYVHRPVWQHDNQKPNQSVSIGSLTQRLAMIWANSVTLNLIDGQYEDMAAEFWYQAQLRAIACVQSAGSNVVITHCWKSVHPGH